MLDRFSIESQGRGSGYVHRDVARPRPARVAEFMLRALDMKRDMDEHGWSLKKAAWKHGVRESLAERLFSLTRLAPEIQRRVLALTLDGAPHVTFRKLLAFVASVPDPQLQRAMFTKLLAGKLRLPMPRRQHHGDGSAGPDAP